MTSYTSPSITSQQSSSVLCLPTSCGVNAAAAGELDATPAALEGDSSELGTMAVATAQSRRRWLWAKRPAVEQVSLRVLELVSTLALEHGAAALDIALVPLTPPGGARREVVGGEEARVSLTTQGERRLRPLLMVRCAL